MIRRAPIDRTPDRAPAGRASGAPPASALRRWAARQRWTPGKDWRPRRVVCSSRLRDGGRGCAGAARAVGVASGEVRGAYREVRVTVVEHIHCVTGAVVPWSRTEREQGQAGPLSRCV